MIVKIAQSLLGLPNRLHVRVVLKEAVQMKNHVKLVICLKVTEMPGSGSLGLGPECALHLPP